MSLTVLAHAAHHVHMDWDSFLDAPTDDGVLLRAIRCFNATVPEPGTHVGEIVAQFFQHFRQQSNLNVKRKIGGGDPEERRRAASTSPAQRTAAEDRKFEKIMSLNRSPRVVIVFVTVERRQASGDLVGHLEERVFGTLCYADGEHYLSRLRHRFAVLEYERSDAETRVYFSLEIVRDRNYDTVLDNVFEAVHLYNRSLAAVNHRTGECNVVYCSDTLYFMDVSKRLFVDNSVTYMYCFLTDKHKPVIESRDDTDAFGLAKILSGVEYSTKCSLKRNHCKRIGHGPLTSVISEGGLNESAKFVNNLIREKLVRSVGRNDDGDGSADRRVRRAYAINEPYVNAFLNRPVECGNMY